VTIKQDADDFAMFVKLRFAELEARIATLEAGEPDPPRPGHNIQPANTTAAAEIDQNAAQRFHESKAVWGLKA
jgi:hypothetical protein